MAKSKFLVEKAYNVGSQIAGMHSAYPQFKCIRNPRMPKHLVFIGEVQPHENLPVYRIKVEYNYSKAPQVFVLSPPLVDNPPHFYRQSKSLCLYHWDDFKWRKDRQLADTVVPWAIGWLFFYEVWKQTGNWYGDEASYSSSNNKPGKPKE